MKQLSLKWCYKNIMGQKEKIPLFSPNLHPIYPIWVGL